MGRKKQKKRNRRAKASRAKQALLVSSVRTMLEDTVSHLAELVSEASESIFLGDENYRHAVAYLLILLREWGTHLSPEEPLSTIFGDETRHNANTCAHITDLEFLREGKYGFLAGCRVKVKAYQQALNGEAVAAEDEAHAYRAQVHSPEKRCTLRLDLLSRLSELSTLPQDWITHAATFYHLIVLDQLQYSGRHSTLRNSLTHPLSLPAVNTLFCNGASPTLETLLSVLFNHYQKAPLNYPKMRSDCVAELGQLLFPEEVAEDEALQEQWRKVDEFHQDTQKEKQEIYTDSQTRMGRYEPYIGPVTAPWLQGETRRGFDKALQPLTEEEYQKEELATEHGSFEHVMENYARIKNAISAIKAAVYLYEKRAFSEVIGRVCRQGNPEAFTVLFQHFQFLNREYSHAMCTVNQLKDQKTKNAPMTTLFHAVCFSHTVTEDLLRHWQGLGFDYERALKKEPKILERLIGAYCYSAENIAAKVKPQVERLLCFLIEALTDKVWLYQRSWEIFAQIDESSVYPLFVKMMAAFNRVDPTLHHQPVLNLKIYNVVRPVSPLTLCLMQERNGYLDLLFKHLALDLGPMLPGSKKLQENKKRLQGLKNQCAKHPNNQRYSALHTDFKNETFCQAVLLLANWGLVNMTLEDVYTYGPDFVDLSSRLQKRFQELKDLQKPVKRIKMLNDLLKTARERYDTSGSAEDAALIQRLAKQTKGARKPLAVRLTTVGEEIKATEARPDSDRAKENKAMPEVECEVVLASTEEQRFKPIQTSEATPQSNKVTFRM